MKVVLEYKREGQQSTGQVLVDEEVLHTFTRVEFEPMLYAFASALRDHPEAIGVIQRTDRPGLIPYVLDTNTVDLFRSDPVAAIRSMSTPYGSPLTTVKRTKEERTPIASGLRIGHNTLADSFGEELYARFDKDRNRVECPCCGIWGLVETADTNGSHTVRCHNPSCVVFQRTLQLKRHNGRWASFLTFDLLTTHSDRFYFPRAWNDGQIWISWENLNTKYQQFLKEKKSCP